MPNAFEKLKVRSKADYYKDDGKVIRAELQKYSNSIHIMLSEDQKMRILAISDELGPLETEKLTGVSEQNIYLWMRKVCKEKRLGKTCDSSKF